MRWTKAFVQSSRRSLNQSRSADQLLPHSSTLPSFHSPLAGGAGGESACGAIIHHVLLAACTFVCILSSNLRWPCQRRARHLSCLSPPATWGGWVKMLKFHFRLPGSGAMLKRRCVHALFCGWCTCVRTSLLVSGMFVADGQFDGVVLFLPWRFRLLLLLLRCERVRVVLLCALAYQATCISWLDSVFVDIQFVCVLPCIRASIVVVVKQVPPF